MRTRPATEKQVEFATTLGKELATATLGEEDAVALQTVRNLWGAAVRDGKVMSGVITVLLDLKRRNSGEAHSVTRVAPEGMHRVGDRIFKVQVAVHGSGRPYAKELVRHGDEWSFEYSAGAMRCLSEGTLMSLDDAKAWGALYGTCCRCGRTLTDEESIAAGIGPICAEKF